MSHCIFKIKIDFSKPTINLEFIISASGIYNNGDHLQAPLNVYSVPCQQPAKRQGSFKLCEGCQLSSIIILCSYQLLFQVLKYYSCEIVGLVVYYDVYYWYLLLFLKDLIYMLTLNNFISVAFYIDYSISFLKSMV